MRGQLRDQSGLFSYIRPEERIPAAHPLRKVRELVREVLLVATFTTLFFVPSVFSVLHRRDRNERQGEASPAGPSVAPGA